MTRRYVWHAFRHVAFRRTLGLLLVLALTACGGEADGAATVSERAESVHDDWVAALRTNNREQALALIADIEFKTAEVDGAFDMIRREMNQTGGAGATGGSLPDVQVVRIQDQGNGTQAWSRWTYGGQTLCHRTDLAQTPAGWRVTSFNLTNDDACTR